MIVSLGYSYTSVPDQDSVYQFIPSKACTPEYNQVPGKGCRCLTTVDITVSPDFHRSLLPWLDSKGDPSLGILLDLKRGGCAYVVSLSFCLLMFQGVSAGVMYPSHVYPI